MTYIHPEKLIEIRRIDLFSYLRMYEPENLIRVSGGVYCTREHDSNYQIGRASCRERV